MSTSVKVLLILMSIFPVSILPGYGQNDVFIFRNINSSVGLASNVVTGIVQDDEGFIWISTTNGVQKYDGYSFTNYHHDPSDPQSIISDNAGFLLKDGKIIYG